MKAKLIDEKGKEKEIQISDIFNYPIRNDILQKVFESQKGLYRTPYGAKIGAGAQYSASGILKHRRHRWKSTYGRGISRIPRKILSRYGSNFNWVGATIASTRGGRRAHPPKSQKNLFRKINKKELKIAFLSALSSTFNEKIIEKKYSKKIPSGIIVKESVLKLKTKDFIAFLKNIFKENLEKVLRKKSIRAGKGKMRGRKYKSNSPLLFVIGKTESMKRKGIEVVKVNELQIKNLSPNGEPGRITLYTEKAIKEIEERFS